MAAAETIHAKEIIARGKTTLDVTWLRGKSLADLDNLPHLDVLEEEIIEKPGGGIGEPSEGFAKP